MARKFLTSIDLAKNELQNAAIQNLATAPASPVAGQIYYDTANSALYVCTNATGPVWEKIVTGNAVTYGNVTAQTSYGLSSGNGSATSVSRSDHTHGTPSLTSVTPSTQAIGDTAVVGTGTAPAREDHKHAMPSFGAVTAQTSYGAASANGTSANIARADHTHGTVSLGSATPAAVNGTTGSAGSATSPSKEDHVHAFSPSSFALSAFAVPSTSVAFNSQRITGLADPSAAQDAATKNYVDSVAQGLDVKASVKVATTTAGTLASSFANGQTVDGVALVTGDRILIKNQAAQTENGIYTVNATGAPTRATDMDLAAEFPGAFTFVEQGTTNADTGWVCTANAPVTIGTTNITWAQFSGAGTYAAGNGLSLAGSTFAFNPTSTGGLQAAAGGASILKPTNSGLVTDATGLYVGAGTGITVSGTTVALTNSSITVNGTAISLGGSGTITAANPNALTLGTGLTGTSYNGSAAVTAAIDTTVVARKFSTTVGGATSVAVTHNLNTRNVVVSVWRTASPYDEIVCDVQHTDANNVTVLFSTAPAAGEYTVTVIG